jgi:hypothetical protein
MMLNEESVGASLQELVAALAAGNYEDAKETLAGVELQPASTTA